MSGCLSGSVYLTVFLAVSRSLSGSDSGPLCLVASVLWRPHNPYKLGGLNLIYWQLGMSPISVVQSNVVKYFKYVKY